MLVLPLVHLCAAPQSPAETPRCSFHLRTKKLNFSTLVHFQSIYMLKIYKLKDRKVLFILAFSSSVRCSVLVLITTFTLFTLKTWENNQNLMSFTKYVNGLHSFQYHYTLAKIKRKCVRTFASNPLTISVLSLLQPQIPDLFLWKQKHHLQAKSTFHYTDNTGHFKKHVTASVNYISALIRKIFSHQSRWQINMLWDMHSCNK